MDLHDLERVMSDIAAEGWSGLGPLAGWGSRSRISFAAVIAGAIVAAATWLLFYLLGAGLGAGSVGALGAPGDAARGAGIWTIIAFALALALGGYVASRLSGTHSHLDGELHGITAWALTVLIGLFAICRILGGPAHVFDAGPSASLLGGQPFIAATESMAPQSPLERLQLALASGGDPTSMSREQIASEISALLSENLASAGSIADADRVRLVDLVAAQYGLTKDQAAQRIAHVESLAKARLAHIDEAARSEAEAIGQESTNAAGALFTSLTLGLLAALLGAWLGTRHKRILHPEEAHLSLAPGYAGLAQPASVSVYDDTGHLVAQYLRGVSFPVSKQDLLRFARANHASTAILQKIEGLADRNYGNANEVLAAIGALS
jgi:hypothetical protein